MPKCTMRSHCLFYLVYMVPPPRCKAKLRSVQAEKLFEQLNEKRVMDSCSRVHELVHMRACMQKCTRACLRAWVRAWERTPESEHESPCAHVSPHAGGCAGRGPCMSLCARGLVVLPHLNNSLGGAELAGSST